MAAPSTFSRRMRFSEFELDLSTRELWNNGSRQVLPAQSFQLLVLLIERRGDLVSREELIRHLWPPDTFVDFDQGLKKAVARLREALADSAEQPRLIETLPRQGYRFIAEVHEIHAEAPHREKLAILRPIPVAEEPEAPPHPPSHRSKRKVALAAALLVLGTLAAIAIWLLRAPSVPRVAEIRALTNNAVPKQSLVTDGARLYYAEMVDGNFGISQISLTGGERLWTKTPFPDPFLYDISPDRSKLLVGDNAAQLWAVPLPTGVPRRLGDLLGRGACWFADGQHILFAWEHDLSSANQDGTGKRKLATIPGYLGGPQISPGQDRLRFNVFDAKLGTMGIWEIRSDGADPHPLWPTREIGVQRCCGKWSPDGKNFFFIGGQRYGDIWAAAGGNAPGRLTNGPLVYSSLATSNDGKQLYAVGTLLRAELTRYDPATDTFAPFLGGVSALDVDISRDGQWAAYVSFPEYTVWISKLDGSERRQLTLPPYHAFLPRWSPDGSKIVFTDLRDAKIFLVDLDTGTPKRLIPGDDKNEIDPSWSPDGSSITFGRTHLDPELAIYDIDVRTHAVRMVPGSKDITSPRMSPDGRFIAALSGDWKSLLLFSTKDNTWQRLATGGFGYPTWSHDSSWLYARRIPHQVVRFSTTDYHMERVVDLQNFQEPGPSWMALAPDGSILLHRDRSTTEIYSITLEYSR